MKSLALLVGLLIIAIGVAGIAAPGGLITIDQVALTRTGLLIVAVLRVAIGLVLIRVSRISRAPKTLHVMGIIVVIAGLTTPLFGVDRARAMIDWWLARGPGATRLVGGCVVLLGGFIVYVVAAGRSTPAQA